MHLSYGNLKQKVNKSMAPSSTDSTPLRDFREHVRRRPAMFVGGTDAHGLFTMLDSAFCLLANELVSRRHSEINVVFHRDSSVSITEGRRDLKRSSVWPIEPMKSLLEIMEPINGRQQGDYRLGFGHENLAVTNALSDWLEVKVSGEAVNRVYRWDQGSYTSLDPLPELSDAAELTVHYMPSQDIFGEARLSATDLKSHFSKFGPLIPEATISVWDQASTSEPQTVTIDKGVAHLAHLYSQAFTPVEEAIRHSTSLKDELGHPAELDFAVQFHNEPGITVISAANMRFTNNGGPHAEGLFQGVQTALNSIDDRDVFDSCHHGPGYTAAVSIRMRQPYFEGATKTRLANQDIRQPVASAVRKAVAGHLAKHNRLTTRLKFG